MTDNPHNRLKFGRKDPDEVGPNPFVRPDDPGTRISYSGEKPGLIQKPMPSWWLVIGLIAGFVTALVVGWLLS